MTINITGILKAPQGTQIQNAEILFEQSRTSVEVLAGTDYSLMTSQTGAYSSSICIGTYTLKVRFVNDIQYRQVASNVIILASMGGYSINQIIADQDALQDVDYSLLDQLIQARDQQAQSQAQAQVSETNSKTSETNALASKNAAQTSQTNAAASATAANTSKTQAATSATAAQTSQTNAANSATQALASKNAAQTSETNAKTAETNAKTSETNAKASETQQQASAATASTQSSTSVTKAQEAQQSAADALVSKNQAKVSETNSKASETQQSGSASTASQAATSATNSATTATTKAGEASTSQTNASSSATLAQKWAANPENTVVSSGLYSALHYAAKAAQSAQTAAGQLIWRGGWSAQAGIAPPTPSVSTQDFYRITQPGIILSVAYQIGDYIHWDTINSIWFKMDGTDSVTSVNGLTGQVTITQSLINAYTKSEVDQIVTDAGYGLKQIQLSAPTGAPATGYVPVIFTNVNHNEYCYINTKTSGGADPMNNCVFDGIVRSGGWSDRGAYVTGQFYIYSDNERALHSIHGGTEADNFYVAYVEVRAFPVTVKVPVGVFVATNPTVSYGTSVFVTNGQDGVGNTKGRKLCDFNKGAGLYQGSGNRVYHEGFKPTPADVGTLSESVINTELNKKFDKVGGTVTGETLFTRPTKFGDTTWKAIVRSSVATNEYLFGGRADNAGDDVTDFVRVGVSKLEYGTSGNRYKIFHEGQVPTLGTDLGLQWQLPSPGGNPRYVRLITLGLTDNDATFILSGFGDNGSAKRATYNVTVATRSSGISVDINAMDVDMLYGGKPRFYHRRVGDVFEVWVKTPAFNLDSTFTRMSGRGVTIRIDSTTTTEPADLTEVTVNQIYTTRFKPSATDLNVVGRYNLGQTDDLRSLRNGGMYRLSDTVVGGPENQLMAYGQLLHVNGGSDTHMQILGNYVSSKLYWRGFNNGAAGGTWRKVYHDGDMPTPTEIGALPITGGTLTGNLVVIGEIRSSGAISYYSNNTNLGIILSSNANGYTEIVRNSNAAEWTEGLRSYGGADWRIGSNRIYTQGFKPSPGDLGAVSKSGDNITGQMQYTGSFNGTSTNAQIAHLGNDASQSLFIRNMREHNSASWVWEKVYNGSLYYSTGVNGGGQSKIRMNVSGSGDIYLGDANKRVYHEGYETTPDKIGQVSTSKLETITQLNKVVMDDGPTVDILKARADLSPFRNKIHNGKFEIAQRGTSLPLPINATEVKLDRFIIGNSTAGRGLVTQAIVDAQYPNTNIRKCMTLSLTSQVESTVPAGKHMRIAHIIEGYEVRDLIGNPFVLSFRAKTTKAGTYCIALRNSARTKTIVKEYTLPANTWQLVQIPYSSLPTNFVTDWDTGLGLEVNWTLVIASDITTTTIGTQIDGLYLATPSQVVWGTSVSDTFSITEIQLEVGNTRTQFEYRPYDVELKLAQRHLQRIYVSIGGYNPVAGQPQVNFITLLSSMRAAPQVSFESGATSANVSAINADVITYQGIRILTNMPSVQQWAWAGTILISAEIL